MKLQHIKIVFENGEEFENRAVFQLVGNPTFFENEYVNRLF